MTITTTKNTAARVSRNVRLLKRLKNSLQMNSKSKKTSRDDGIKQFSIQHPLITHVLCNTLHHLYIRWGCILNCYICAIPTSP